MLGFKNKTSETADAEKDAAKKNPKHESAKRRPFALCAFALSRQFASITQKST